MPTAPPYIYAAPRSHAATDPWRTFDPKAHTRASFVPKPAMPRRPAGPLLDFNKHPDSYVALPYGQTNVPPLPASTKIVVVAARWLQLVLRSLGLLGAVGVLVCVICLKNVQESASLVIRIPPAADVVISSYAVLHLARSARRRTPASSASYHLFSCIMDTCLVPFYVYICLNVRANAALPLPDKSRWGSFWDALGTSKLFQAAVLASVCTAGLHVVGLVVGVFLTLKFRQIANMPPDMNPLEENLTSRNFTRHQKHLSESSSGTESARTSTLSMDSSKRFSTAKDSGDLVQSVPFLGTRAAEAAMLYNPHNPRTAMWSRASLSTTNQDARWTHADIQTDDSAYSQNSTLSAAGPSLRQGLDGSEVSSLRPSTACTADDFDSHPRVPRKSSKRVSDSNWAVLEDSSGSDQDHPSSPEKWRKDYRHLNSLHGVDPLAMNPLTPPASVRAMQTSPFAHTSANGSWGSENTSSRREKKPYGKLSLDKDVPDFRGIVPKQGRSSPGILPGDWYGTSQADEMKKQPAFERRTEKTRVISRSGVDLTDVPLTTYDDWEDSSHVGYGGNGRRHVSGKTAEEGQAGTWARRRISGKLLRM